MLKEAHKALEAMTSACAAIKVEEWGEAERSLHQVQETVARLLREAADPDGRPNKPIKKRPLKRAIMSGVGVRTGKFLDHVLYSWSTL